MGFQLFEISIRQCHRPVTLPTSILQGEMTKDSLLALTVSPLGKKNILHFGRKF